MELLNTKKGVFFSGFAIFVILMIGVFQKLSVGKPETGKDTPKTRSLLHRNVLASGQSNDSPAETLETHTVRHNPVSNTSIPVLIDVSKKFKQEASLTNEQNTFVPKGRTVFLDQNGFNIATLPEGTTTLILPSSQTKVVPFHEIVMMYERSGNMVTAYDTLFRKKVTYHLPEDNL